MGLLYPLFQTEIRGLFEILGKIARGLGHSTEFQYRVPPEDGWTVRESDPDSGRYAKELCDLL